MRCIEPDSDNETARDEKKAIVQKWSYSLNSLKGGYIRDTTGLYRGYMGIMEKKMETTIKDGGGSSTGGGGNGSQSSQPQQVSPRARLQEAGSPKIR